MLPPPVDADLSLSQAASGVSVELRVHAPSRRSLSWSLTATTRSAGGVSRTQQTGATDGADPRPLAHLTFGPGATGVLDVTVRDAAGVAVERSCRFGGSSPDGTPQC